MGPARAIQELCEWIAELHGTEPGRVMVTNGSMEGAALLFRHYVGAGDRVIVEQPTYDRTLLLLNQAGAELAPVPLESDGVQIGAFEDACAAGPVKFAHVIPNFHNPCRLHARGREARAAGRDRRRAWPAAVRGRSLSADQASRATPASTMLDLDEADRVIHASSFSKTVSPGVGSATGWAPGGRDRPLCPSAPARPAISPNMLAESIVWELCRSGALDENIKVVNAAPAGLA